MFPLQRSNELVMEFSNVQPQQKISKDLILDDQDIQQSPLVPYSSHKRLRSSRPNQLFYGTTTHPQDQYAKKMLHRDIERQRRQEMATLHASFRSLLPLRFIKGKRSISDQMNEGVNYINYLQNNIKELTDKRDKLKRKLLTNSSPQSHDENNRVSSGFTVHQNCGGGGAGRIQITGFTEQDFPLSKLLQIVLDEGLQLVTCLSTKVNGRLLHSMQCEVDNSDSVDLSELRRKFSNVIP